MTHRKPTRIHVGPFTWHIDWTITGWSQALDDASLGADPDAARTYGMTDKRSCRIWINPHSAEDFQRETLLHELLHACQFVAGLGTTTTDPEDFIMRVSPLLLDTLTRNKGLLTYLTGRQP